MNKELNNYYIVYFDILGYKAFFEDMENDINEFLDFNINLVKDTLQSAKQNTRIFAHPFTLKMFSDNFVILVEENSVEDYYIIRILSYLMAKLQLRFLEKYRIVIRGVITKGPIYVDEHILFGEGLIRAVEKESQEKFPRILIDSDRIDPNDCKDLCKEFVAKDEDDAYYVDFLSIINDNMPEDNTLECLNSVRTNIITLVKKYGNYNQALNDYKKAKIAEKTISKYAWLLSKFNTHCNGTYKDWKIPYKLNLNCKLMKYEIDISE